MGFQAPGSGGQLIDVSELSLRQLEVLDSDALSEEVRSMLSGSEPATAGFDAFLPD